MGFAIVHMQKHSASAVKGLQIHNNREKESLTNPDIDSSKLGDNYDLIGCDDYSKKIADEIGKLDLKKALRKDAVYMCSFVITSDNETMLAMSDEERSSFFKDSLKFFSERYGDQNIISATVHNDEKTPHLHLNLVPIKDGKLSANYIFDKLELKQLQTDFHSSIGVKYNLERGQEDKGVKHLSELKYKIKTAEENLNKYTKSLDREMSISEIYAINAEKTLTGAIKGVSVETIDKLKKTAIRSLERDLDVQKEIDKQDYLKRQLDTVSKEYQHVNQRVRELNKLQAAVRELPPAIQKEIESKIHQKEKSKNRSFER